MLRMAVRVQRGYEADAFPARLVVRQPPKRYALPGARSLQARIIAVHMGHLTIVQRRQSCPAGALHHLLRVRLAAALIGPVHARAIVSHIPVAGYRVYQAVSPARCQSYQWSPSTYKESKGWHKGSANGNDQSSASPAPRYVAHACPELECIAQ